jgi:ATP-dependent Clp protease ATP-binding subunit ClpB
VRKLLADRGMSLHLSETAVRHLSERGTDLKYGARPMKRLIQNALLNPLATLILQVIYASLLFTLLASAC